MAVFQSVLSPVTVVRVARAIDTVPVEYPGWVVIVEVRSAQLHRSWWRSWRALFK